MSFAIPRIVASRSATTAHVPGASVLHHPRPRQSARRLAEAMLNYLKRAATKAQCPWPYQSRGAIRLLTWILLRRVRRASASPRPLNFRRAPRTGPRVASRQYAASGTLQGRRRRLRPQQPGILHISQGRRDPQSPVPGPAGASRARSPRVFRRRPLSLDRPCARGDSAAPSPPSPPPEFPAPVVGPFSRFIGNPGRWSPVERRELPPVLP